MAEGEVKSLKGKVKEKLKNRLESIKVRLEKEFEEKFKKKKKQFLYSAAFDDEILRAFTLTSSLESKMGNTLNAFILDVLDDKETTKTLGWLTNSEVGELLNKLSGGKVKVERKNTTLRVETPDYRGKRSLSIDLILASPDKNGKRVVLNMIEIKSGGDIDGKKAKQERKALENLVSQIVKHLKNSNNLKLKLKFATLYNPRGEESNWTGAIHSEFNQEDILIGSSFWEFFFRDALSFNEFLSLYREAARESGLNKVAIHYLRGESDRTT